MPTPGTSPPPGGPKMAQTFLTVLIQTVRIMRFVPPLVGPNGVQKKSGHCRDPPFPGFKKKPFSGMRDISLRGFVGFNCLYMSFELLQSHKQSPVGLADFFTLLVHEGSHLMIREKKGNYNFHSPAELKLSDEQKAEPKLLI